MNKDFLLFLLTRKRLWVGVAALIGAIAAQFSPDAGTSVKNAASSVIDAVFETGTDESESER